MDVIPQIPQSTIAAQSTRWCWFSPARCRLVLGLLLSAGFLFHLRFLLVDCPIDLVGDEAQYWDWSRNLDISYYSKGPLIAYIIRASCAVFGETMPAIRLPALLLSVGTSIVTYWLTARLFRSERIALGAVVLYHLVPVFVAGSVLMTIDPPFYFCWACATLFAAIAIFEDKRWAWIWVGVFVGIGFLGKYAMFLWFVGLFIFLLFDLNHRALLRKPWPWIALFIALLALIPVLVWNRQHGWVSFKHVAHQTGASGGRLAQGNFFEFMASQFGVLGLMSIFMIAAIRYAMQNRGAVGEPFRGQMRYLVCIGLPFLGLVAVSSLLAKAQVNWPAPAYFSLMILSAYFIATRMRSIDSWRRWRGCVYATVVFGLILSPLVHDISILFPLLSRIGVNPAKVDFMARLRGWKSLGQRVTQEQHLLGEGSFVLCDDYMQTAEMAFYVAGQPKTYYAGSYFASDPKRYTQYDMWPDRNLENNPLLVGRNAVYVGKGGRLPNDVEAAFERTQRLPEIPVIVRGVTVKTFKLWRCYGFKGMRRPVVDSF